MAGEIENERIRLSKLRSAHKNNNNLSSILEISDIEMTDLQYFNMCLEESRRLFLNSDMFYDTQIFDNIVQQSLQQEKRRNQ